MVSQVLSGPYTGYLLQPVASHLPEYQDCKIEDTGFFTHKVDIAFAFQKSSFLRQMFNKGLLKMIENGEIQRLFEKHGLNKQKKSNCGGARKGQTLGFENILVVFIVLGCGILISLLILFVEFLIKYNFKQH